MLSFREAIEEEKLIAWYYKLLKSEDNVKQENDKNMETITENIADRICKMERDLTFYENAIVIIVESIRRNTMLPIVKNGSSDAVAFVNDLYIEIEDAILKGCIKGKETETAEDKI